MLYEDILRKEFESGVIQNIEKWEKESKGTEAYNFYKRTMYYITYSGDNKIHNAIKDKFWDFFDSDYYNNLIITQFMLNLQCFIDSIIHNEFSYRTAYRDKNHKVCDKKDTNAVTITLLTSSNGRNDIKGLEEALDFIINKEKDNVDNYTIIEPPVATYSKEDITKTVKSYIHKPTLAKALGVSGEMMEYSDKEKETCISENKTMIKIREVIMNNYLKYLHEEFDFSTENGIIVTPFEYTKSEKIEIFIEEYSDEKGDIHVTLSDRCRTYDYMFINGVDIPKYLSVIKNISSKNSVNYDSSKKFYKDEFYVTTYIEHTGEALYNLINTIITVVQLLKLKG
jgi:hypothetical protein